MCPIDRPFKSIKSFCSDTRIFTNRSFFLSEHSYCSYTKSQLFGVIAHPFISRYVRRTNKKFDTVVTNFFQLFNYWFEIVCNNGRPGQYIKSHFNHSTLLFKFLRNKQQKLYFPFATISPCTEHLFLIYPPSFLELVFRPP